MMSGTGNAATLTSGGSVCEGPGGLLPVNAVCDQTFGDGGQKSGPSVAIDFSGTGSGTIFGGIRGQSRNRYADVFGLVGEGTYQLTLTAVRFTDVRGRASSSDPAFDATWWLDDTLIGTIDNQLDTPITSLTTMFDLSGPDATIFRLDAAGGYTKGNVMEYRVDIEAVDLAVMPLPAGMVLLLSGMGALAFTRRRRTS
ncbi:MAG: VPLPA-CTERM sorting domain-containing protein [Pseudomonadota bacterium]